MHVKLWEGRFTQETDELMERFNRSFDFDRRLYAADIQGSMAYAKALARAGIVTADERDLLLDGLSQVRDEFEEGTFQPAPSDEDIHTAVERRLRELIGPVAGKLHTGRSRNDQVVTDVRIYLMEHLDRLDGLLTGLQGAIVEQAEDQLDLLMPGYTHLQRAQPVRFSHWMLSYFWMLQRDRERLHDARRRIPVCPLGSGALAGHSLGIDREFLARELGFQAISENSIDAVSDRDFILEVLSGGAILGMHLSRLAEDITLYASAEFGFVELNEAYSTGSSLMPQKKNPDSAELMRGKAGRLVGNLVSLLVTAKGLPAAYDKDLQEDKEPLFDTLDALELMLPVAAGMIRTMRVNPGRMRAALDDSLLATDLADYLVRKGVPFRRAHNIVGRAVRYGIEEGKSLRELSSAEWRRLSPLFEADVVDVFDFERSVEQKSSPGGTARSAVEAQIAGARELMAT
ncbi:MAG: argininosuccinate lyase [Chloroflexota bacterium]|nr:argininosuccinate lyase [Chloroflexota bacterium]